MTQKTTVSAPGKIHLVGEHVVVYGKPAVIAAIDRRCYVSLTQTNDKTVEIISKNYSVSETMQVDDVLQKTKHARKIWDEFMETKDTETLFPLTKHPLDYPFLAVGESILKFPLKENGLRIEIDSSIPIGSGCGSSSAIAVTIAGGIQKLLFGKIDPGDVYQIALRIEEYKHGTPSGGDPATVLYGGFVWFENNSQSKTITPLDIALDKALWNNFLLVDTGKPKESTGEMIGIVREFMNSDPEKADKLFSNQESLTNQLISLLKAKNPEETIRVIRQAERNLESMGVVSEYVKKLIVDIEDAGGAAKISGGGGRSHGTGMLLVYSENLTKVKEVLTHYRLSYTEAILGEEGLREE